MNEGRNLGVVKPDEFGEWKWPFKHMAIGDYFYVMHGDREPERVRNMASVRAAQLGKHFSCEKYPEEMRGAIRVKCVPKKTEAELRKEFDYMGFRSLVGEQYGIDPDDIPWAKCSKPGDTFVHFAKKRKGDYRRAVRVMVGDDFFVVELRQQSLYITMVDRQQSLDAWLEGQMRLLLD